MSKLIVVSGNNNSGKTVFSYYLANKLAINDKRIMIVSTNNAYPNMPMLLPIEKDKVKTKSLGRVLSLAVINQQDILDNMITFNNENIGLLCYGLSETQNTYPAISHNNLEVFFELMQNLVDYIIVDAQAVNNNIDSYALANADIKFCITTADLKGLGFRQHIDESLEYTHILYSNSTYNPFEDIRATFSQRVKYTLPFIKGLQKIYNGAFLDNMDCPKSYSKFLNKIIKEIIENV